MKKTLKLIISIVLPLFIGYLGSLATKSSVNSWYLTLNKPSFNPPNWVFAPVWTGLFILMGISCYIIWNKIGRIDFRNLVYLIYFFQLIFNLLWSVLFFSFRNPILGLVNIILLWILAVVNIKLFYRISKLAGWLLIPYILWLSFAFVLNFAIVILN
ncbi:MAG: tryptophan-rich sensory protein [Endomicrobia bacterium]|nr:tryptophan-rich sensory protein [Endomicrobiia bacterium]